MLIAIAVAASLVPAMAQLAADTRRRMQAAVNTANPELIRVEIKTKTWVEIAGQTQESGEESEELLLTKQLLEDWKSDDPFRVDRAYEVGKQTSINRRRR